MRIRSLIVALALALPAAAPAQFSDSYSFLKAVRDRDGAKATEFVSRPGTVLIDTRDSSTGETALHIVTKARDINWMAFLLARNANPNIRDNQGNSPLLSTAQIGFVEGAQMLLKRGASVDLSGSGGETPLIRAVQNRDAAMVRLLMLNGANPGKVDTSAGLSARDYATRDRRSAAILKILEETKSQKPAGAVAGPKL